MLKDFKTLIGSKTEEKIAIENYMRQLRENPEPQPEVRFALGKLYEKIGNKEAARQEYSRSARLYENAGEPDKATAVNKLILKLDPQDKDALANLSLLNFQQGANVLAHQDEQASPEREAPSSEQTDAAVANLRKKPVAESAGKSSKVKSPKKDAQARKISLLDLTKENAQAGEQIISQLRQLPLLAKVSHADLLELKGRAIVWDCPQNSIVAPTEQNQESFFILLAGSVNIVERPEAGQDIVLTTLAGGDFWGEHTLFGQDELQLFGLTDRPCKILELSGAVIRALAKKRPSSLDILKNACQRWLTYPTIARVSLFKYLTTQERQEIMAHLTLVAVEKGATIIAEGEREESLYLIKSGEVGVYATFGDPEALPASQTEQLQLFLATLRAGDFFGEAAFLTKKPRIASIFALTNVQLFKLAKPDLEQLIKNYPEIEKILTEYYQERTLSNRLVFQSIQ